MGMTLIPLFSWREALVARRIRNEVRYFLTGDTRYIGPIRQIVWFYRTYLPGLRKGDLSFFLAEHCVGEIVGYAGLQRRGEYLCTTIAVAPGYWGRGYSRDILRGIVGVAHDRGHDALAIVRQDNEVSLRIHDKENGWISGGRGLEGEVPVFYFFNPVRGVE